MPQFKPSNIVELELPSSTKDDPAKVTMDLTVTGGMAEDTFAGKRVSATLADAIKSWNFTDESGKPIDITEATVRHLDPDDFAFLAEKIVSKLSLTVSARAVSSSEKKA